MATQTQRIQLIVDAQNRTQGALQSVNKSLDKVKRKVQAMQPAFRKMALIGTAAFAAIGAGIGAAVKEAAIAEGSFAKFNTVFGEGSEDMLEFVDDIRGEMPLARHEIVRMSADLQDLLVPLGLTREKGQELTKGFVDLANKVAAFNDVDPSEVIEAFKSGLAGSSEPLRRFGINALESALEARALEEGLLGVGQTFKDLEPEIKNQIRAQALLAQAVDNSSDAIEGFEENNDSLIRRSQDLNASIKELKVSFGEVFAPVVDEVVKKLIPLVEKISEWIKENPKITATIIKLTVALVGVVAALGILGLALPAIITAITLLTGPIGIVVAVVAAMAAILIKANIDWKNFMQSIDEKTGIITMMRDIWDEIKTLWSDFVIPALVELKKALEPLAPIGEMLVKVFGIAFVGALMGVIQIIRILANLFGFIITIGAKLMTGIVNIWVKGFEKLGDIVNWVVTKVEKLIAVMKQMSSLQGAAKIVNSTVNRVLGRASGGQVQPNRTFLVGENGPELFSPSQQGRIINKPFAGAGLGGTVNITISGNEFLGEEGIAERIGDDIIRVLKNTVKL